MAFQPVPDTVNLIPYFTLPNTQTANNVLAFTSEVPINTGSMALLSALYEDWFAEFADLSVSSQVSLSRIKVVDLTSEDSFVNDRDIDPAIPGANGAAVLPSNVSACIKFGSPFAGKSKRGRTYWVGLTETMVAGDYVNPGTLNVIVDSYEQLRDAALAIGFIHCVISRWSGGVLRPTGVTTTITSYQAVTERVGSQRRRLPRPGQG